MDRRSFVAAVGSALAAPRVFAQATRAVPRIGLLWIRGPGVAGHDAAFREGMRAQALVDGQNVRIDASYLVEDYASLERSAARMASDGLDVIVAYGTTAVQAAAKASRTIPIVMIAAGDPVKAGVAASLARPGGNVTGFTSIAQELSGKRLDLLLELVPSLRRFAVVLFPGSQSERESALAFEALAKARKVDLVRVEIPAPDALESAIAGISALRVQAIIFVGSTMFTANSERIVGAAHKTRLPALYSNQAFVEAGGLMVFGADVRGNFRRAPEYIGKILKGTKPADLPIEQPNIVELSVNLKTAKELGINVPRSLLLRADRVIE